MHPTTHQARTLDGLSLHVESTGEGTPLLFIHEFAGDHRSWRPQVHAFSRRYRCITYAARGYPPSDIPPHPGLYSQDHAVADALSVLDTLEIDQAHVIGLSMGGFCALHLGLSHPERVLSVCIGGVGYGAPRARREAFRAECEEIARAFETEPIGEVAARYALGPARVQFQRKDSKGHAEFTRMLAEHSAVGSAGTMRGFQRERPSLYDFSDALAVMDMPVLIMVGDEDEGAIEPSIMLKRAIPTSGLAVFPKTGHTLNLEEPDLFNRSLQGFLDEVTTGRWGARDPRSLSVTTTGFGD